MNNMIEKFAPEWWNKLPEWKRKNLLLFSGVEGEPTTEQIQDLFATEARRLSSLALMQLIERDLHIRDFEPARFIFEPVWRYRFYERDYPYSLYIGVNIE